MDEYSAVITMSASMKSYTEVIVPFSWTADASLPTSLPGTVA